MGVGSIARGLTIAVLAGLVASCGSNVRLTEPAPSTPAATATAPAGTPREDADVEPLPPPLASAKSRWQPVRWSELPGFGEDAIGEAWGAWLRSCERPAATFAATCREVRRLAIAAPGEQRAWMRRAFQPYRVEPIGGAPSVVPVSAGALPAALLAGGSAPAPAADAATGLLTAYYEPLLEARRSASATHAVPLYQPPASLASKKPWYTRQEIDTLPEARAQLRGREIAWLADPLDALVLQIQGSGRLRIAEDDGRSSLVRLAFAGTNDQPYRSVGAWLLAQGAVRDATWPGIKAWAVAHPQRVNEMLWTNPRTVFFREESLAGPQASDGPRGAQGVPLTAGRSIAVDPQSVPYGTPVWIESVGPQAALRRLVLAQDTGTAITGAVRADYYAGSGAAAGELAGRLKQPLRMWVLWPR